MVGIVVEFHIVIAIILVAGAEQGSGEEYLGDDEIVGFDAVIGLQDNVGRRAVDVYRCLIGSERALGGSRHKYPRRESHIVEAGHKRYFGSDGKLLSLAGGDIAEGIKAVDHIGAVGQFGHLHSHMYLGAAHFAGVKVVGASCGCCTKNQSSN